MRYLYLYIYITSIVINIYFIHIHMYISYRKHVSEAYLGANFSLIDTPLAHINPADYFYLNCAAWHSSVRSHHT